VAERAIMFVVPITFADLLPCAFNLEGARTHGSRCSRTKMFPSVRSGMKPAASCNGLAQSGTDERPLSLPHVTFLSG
jgi:hypothetical protein